MCCGHSSFSVLTHKTDEAIRAAPWKRKWEPTKFDRLTGTKEAAGSKDIWRFFWQRKILSGWPECLYRINYMIWAGFNLRLKYLVVINSRCPDERRRKKLRSRENCFTLRDVSVYFETILYVNICDFSLFAIKQCNIQRLAVIRPGQLLSRHLTVHGRRYTTSPGVHARPPMECEQNNCMVYSQKWTSVVELIAWFWCPPTAAVNVSDWFSAASPRTDLTRRFER
jgi:hypothetical protein